MLVILGYAIVIGAVFGGFVLGGGSLGPLYQPSELVMIAGAAAGAFVVGNTGKAIRATLRALPETLHGPKYTKQAYLDVLALLYDLLVKARKEGMMMIEVDVEQPAKSPLFKKYPSVLADTRVLEFMTDNLRLMVGGNLNAFEIENLLDHEIGTHIREGEIPAQCVNRVADSMPAFGIVVAVMGVVRTMASVGLPPAELGILIAHALVGTFLGILLAYGFVGPLAGTLEQKVEERTKMLECVKITLLASLNGYSPAIAVEFGRKVLFSSERPGFLELEAHVKGRRPAAPKAARS